jgi:hypothetical protein
MKTKYLLLGMGALLLAGGLWFARAAWRAHQQIVTLDVYNTPLAEVLRKVEWQTWRKIRAEKNLDARITLHVKDKPLPYVLDRLAEQAGARWSTLYAVYGSKRGLKSLDSALRADGKLEPAGWTKLAPTPQTSMLPDPGESGAPSRIMINPNSSGPDVGAPGLALGAGPDPGSPAPPPGKGGVMMFKRAGNGVMVTDDASGQMEVWSAEELAMESALSDRLGGEHTDEATTAAAEELARKVKGKWTTYLAFRKSIMGVGFGAPPTGRPTLDPTKHNPNDRFSRLTPQQRVERARNRQGFEPK